MKDIKTILELAADNNIKREKWVDNLVKLDIEFSEKKAKRQAIKENEISIIAEDYKNEVISIETAMRKNSDNIFDYIITLENYCLRLSDLYSGSQPEGSFCVPDTRKINKKYFKDMEQDIVGLKSSLEDFDKIQNTDYTSVTSQMWEQMKEDKIKLEFEKSVLYSGNSLSSVSVETIDQLMGIVANSDINRDFKKKFKQIFNVSGLTSRYAMACILQKEIFFTQIDCLRKIYQLYQIEEADKNKAESNYQLNFEECEQRYERDLEILEQEIEREKRNTNKAINEFDNSKELLEFRNEIEEYNAKLNECYGDWNNYSQPYTMPTHLVLCNTMIDSHNSQGMYEKLRVPVCIDLFQSNVIVITSENNSQELNNKKNEFVRKIIARALKTIPLNKCAYSIFDSLHKGSSLDRLIDVTNVNTDDFEFGIFTSNDVVETGQMTCGDRRLILKNRQAKIIREMGGKGSLYKFNKNEDTFIDPFTWYFDFNFPDSIDGSYLEDINELFANSNLAGYSYVFVTGNEGFNKIKKILEVYDDINLYHIDVGQSIIESSGIIIPYYEYSSPTSEQISSFVSALKKFCETENIIDNRMASVFDKYGIEINDAANTISIPVAFDGKGTLVDLKLGQIGKDDIPHCFISGTTGSGKTTLLHSIILSACLHYSPTDLEIWLVDYKGTEFDLYKKNTPPNIKLIGVSLSEDFTYSFLDKIVEENENRKKLFKKFGSRKYVDYRKHCGEGEYINLPRLLVIIDEFHIMSQFAGNDSNQVEQLNNIFKDGRTQGINIISADQDFSSGINSLKTDAKAQIGVRIAMRNDKNIEEIRDTLAVNSLYWTDSLKKMALELQTGEFIMESHAENGIRYQKFKAVCPDDADLVAIGKALKILYKGLYDENVLYVNSEEQTEWQYDDIRLYNNLNEIKQNNLRFYLGKTTTIEPCFVVDMYRKPKENLSIVGGDSLRRMEVLASIMKSCEYNGYKLKVFIQEHSEIYTEFEDEIHNLCEKNPFSQLIDSNEAWIENLHELLFLLDEEKINNVVCLFIGLEDVQDIFQRDVEIDYETKLAMTVVAMNNGETECLGKTQDQQYNFMQNVNQLFFEGSKHGIRCIAEFSTVDQFNSFSNIDKMCNHRIAFNMNADEYSRYIIDSYGGYKKIGENAIYSYCDKNIKRLIPYKLS